MDKVLVEVFVPVINTSYDIFIPLCSQVYEVLELIKKAVTKMSDGLFIANQTTAVCYRSSGEIININLSVYESGIRNGSKLMLI